MKPFSLRIRKLEERVAFHCFRWILLQGVFGIFSASLSQHTKINGFPKKHNLYLFICIKHLILPFADAKIRSYLLFSLCLYSYVHMATGRYQEFCMETNSKETPREASEKI